MNTVFIIYLKRNIIYLTYLKISFFRSMGCCRFSSHAWFNPIVAVNSCFFLSLYIIPNLQLAHRFPRIFTSVSSLLVCHLRKLLLCARSTIEPYNAIKKKIVHFDHLEWMICHVIFGNTRIIYSERYSRYVRGNNDHLNQCFHQIVSLKL